MIVRTCLGGTEGSPDVKSRLQRRDQAVPPRAGSCLDGVLRGGCSRPGGRSVFQSDRVRFGRPRLVLPGVFRCRRDDPSAGEARSTRAAGMTALEFFASIGVPALLVVCAYVSVLVYERTSPSEAEDARDKHDTNSV